METLERQKDYKEALEKAAKQMILIHNVDILVKMILRTVVRTLRLEHVSILVYDKAHDAYVVHSSRGKAGLKIPKGFARITNDNPVIQYFTDHNLQVFGKDYLLFSQLKDSQDVLQQELKNQFLLYNAKACIPGFFRERLVCALFLGEKLEKIDFTSDELGFMSALSSDVVMAIQNANLFQDLNEQLLKNKNLFLQTVFALSSAIEAKDQYMQGHTERVTRYALVIAHNLMRSNQVIVDNLKVIDKVTDADIKKFLENLRISAMLHDIGKIGIPEAILNKKLELNDLEREEIKKHTYIGAKILSEVNEFYEPVLGVKHHHERYDGTGYPEGLAGEKIPFIARIISVADAYDAMTTDRPYRVALTKEKALLIIEAGKSKQFDASIVDAFLLAYKKGEI